MNKFCDIMPQARYARKGESHTYERSVFLQSHYVAKYMLTCLNIDVILLSAFRDITRLAQSKRINKVRLLSVNH